MSSSSAIVRRQSDDLSLMPPPPSKRIKRPAIALDEDDYTDALTEIIERDYYPGLLEAKAQEEYLSALESNNEAWIQEAGQKLHQASIPASSKKSGRMTRDTRYNAFVPGDGFRSLGDTPRGNHGGETPLAPLIVHDAKEMETSSSVDLSGVSLSTFQAKYTSEDNESFNTVVDKQNAKRREKHLYLWTPTQQIPLNRLVTYRRNEARLIKQKDMDKDTAVNEGRELVPIVIGATASRPAKPDSWRSRPNNNLMFMPDSIDESGDMATVMEQKGAASKAGPKEIVFANTRFPPAYLVDDPGPVPQSPSLNTSIVARRDAARANRANTETIFSGGGTPRVNGYSFVDEDEEVVEVNQEPSYRDLLAGQVGDLTSNPFTIHKESAREDLHHRLVEKEKAKKRLKDKEVIKTPLMSVSTGGRTPSGNMTPAAQKLMERLGRTPLPGRDKNNRTNSKEMWTPSSTPRRR